MRRLFTDPSFKGFTDFAVGDRIRAYEFPPHFKCEDLFVEGEILSIHTSPNDGFHHYLIAVTADTVCPPGARTQVKVPMLTTMDGPERIIKLDP